ncbi:hypothetical protein CF319_g2653 [Tilletia indica]|nr:hypothetical protein CF319_g2653 [Tilletia indica]
MASTALDQGFRCDLCRAIGQTQSCRYDGDPAHEDSVSCHNCKVNQVECSFLHEFGMHLPKAIYLPPKDVLYQPLQKGSRKRKASERALEEEGEGKCEGDKQSGGGRWLAFDPNSKAFLKAAEELPGESQVQLMVLRAEQLIQASSSSSTSTTTTRAMKRAVSASPAPSRSSRPSSSSSTSTMTPLAKVCKGVSQKKKKKKREEEEEGEFVGGTNSKIKGVGVGGRVVRGVTAPPPSHGRPSRTNPIRDPFTPTPSPARSDGSNSHSALVLSSAPASFPHPSTSMSAGRDLIPTSSMPQEQPSALISPPVDIDAKLFDSYASWLDRQSSMTEKSIQTDRQSSMTEKAIQTDPPPTSNLDEHIITVSRSVKLTTSELFDLARAQTWELPDPNAPESCQILACPSGSSAVVAGGRYAAAIAAGRSNHGSPMGSIAGGSGSGSGSVDPSSSAWSFGSAAPVPSAGSVWSLGSGMVGARDDGSPEAYAVRPTAQGLDDVLYLGPPEL